MRFLELGFCGRPRCNGRVGILIYWGIEPGKLSPSFAAILQVTHPEDRGQQAEVENALSRRPPRSGANFALSVGAAISPGSIARSSFSLILKVTPRKRSGYARTSLPGRIS